MGKRTHEVRFRNTIGLEIKFTYTVVSEHCKKEKLIHCPKNTNPNTTSSNKAKIQLFFENNPIEVLCALM